MQKNKKTQHKLNETINLIEAREKKLLDLQASIQEGTYNVSGMRIASRLLQKEIYKNVIPWNSV